MQNILWTYWHQGFDEAPYVVQRCIHQLKVLHPNWQINMLDQSNIKKWGVEIAVRKEVWVKLSLPHRSDLIRTNLLIEHGGVWIDPTVFCMQSLDEWLMLQMNAGLFLFQHPGRDRIISNWFIAAESDNYFLKKLFQEMTDYWDNNHFKNFDRPITFSEKWINRFINRNISWPRLWFHPIITNFIQLYPYMVYHYKFYDLIMKDKQCMGIWRNMPNLPADVPHMIQREGLLNPLTDKVKKSIDQINCPIYKLRWDLNKDEIPEGSNLDYLLGKFRT